MVVFGVRSRHGALRKRAARIVVATAAACVLGLGALPASASPKASTGGPGTVGAKDTAAIVNTTVHSPADVPSDATGALSTIVDVQGDYDYVAAGIGMRNLGYGTIDISGIPDGATVKSATLLWDILADAAGPAFATGKLDGTSISGSPVGTGASPCWPVSDNFSYQADVTSLVTGNGEYQLSGFSTGESDGADPWADGSNPPLLDGASLVVIYQDSTLPSRDIQIDGGATETDSGNSATATMSGFTASASPDATTTYIVADGQEAGNTASFGSETLPDVSFPGADPQAVANYSQGNLWDTVTTDVSDEVASGDTSATASVTGNEDCLVWVGQVLSVTSAGDVLGLGDSVTAGYGLGYSRGDGDNPSAYPLLLANQLGVPGEDDAVEGACASATETDCADQESLYVQIQHAPASSDPSVITMSIGADDIDFSTCIPDIMFYNAKRTGHPEPDLNMTWSGDPCSARNLARALAAFRTNFAVDLNAIKNKFPDSKVLVLDYYDPFPAASASTAATCNLFTDAALANEYNKAGQSWLAAVSYYIREHAAYLKTAAQIQDQVTKDAASILAQLNSAINADVAQAVGQGLDADVITADDLSAHNVCTGTSSWIFAPTGQVYLYLLHYPIVSFQFDPGQPVCIDPSAGELAANPAPIVVGTENFGIKIQVQANCMPHPTAVGQQQLAADFLDQGGLGDDSSAASSG